MLTTEGATRRETFWKIRINGFAIFSNFKISFLNSSTSPPADILCPRKINKIKQIIILELRNFRKFIYIIREIVLKIIVFYNKAFDFCIYALLLSVHVLCTLILSLKIKKLLLASYFCLYT